MANWKVDMTIGENRDKKTIFVRDTETIEKAYSIAKNWFITNNPEIVFWGVDKAVKV